MKVIAGYILAVLVTYILGAAFVSQGNIAAITHLVSGSVEGLTSDKVTVIDSQGRLLSDDTDQSTGGCRASGGRSSRPDANR